MNPYWLCGLVDGKGRFDVVLSDGATLMKHVHLSFSIVMNRQDTAVLHRCKRFFGVGIISDDPKTGVATYKVESAHHIENSILPFFEEYPLVSRKKILWMRFRRSFMWKWRHQESHPDYQQKYVNKIKHLISCKSGFENGYDLDKSNT
mmetsp:Transcript_5031/g.5824  ORF Transcript_5031/g.5824 Transcript_5031/m.5824 type:complete len:148 (-) Transcript_5031:30-473(-)